MLRSITGSSPLLFPSDDSRTVSEQPRSSTPGPRPQAALTPSRYTVAEDESSRFQRICRGAKSLLSTAQSAASRHWRRYRRPKKQITWEGSQHIGGTRAGTRGPERLDAVETDIDAWTKEAIVALDEIGRSSGNLTPDDVSKRFLPSH